MKRPKEKQTPIFSKVHNILGEHSPAPLPEEPMDRHERPSPVQLGVREALSPGTQVETAPGGSSPQPDNQGISSGKIEESTQVEMVSPRIIRPPEGIEAVVNSLGMAFVLIPAGIFVMGSPEYEPGRYADEMKHEVTISLGFYLQTTPVTQGQWQAVMGHNPASIVQAGTDLPVAGINWRDCQEFIKKFNALEEGTYRLPSEAEWEYACRAGSYTSLANGELINNYCELDPSLDEIGWYCGNCDRRLHPVGQKAPNAWGFYDMHGNVAEWCQDWYSAYPELAQTDPTGAISGPGRVVRGGSWFSSAKNCRSAARYYWPPQSRDQLQVLGFRLVKIS
jgi:formylglycine-generating enzyme required for sulfatase activity